MDVSDVVLNARSEREMAEYENNCFQESVAELLMAATLC
jgi:hypothetical protein